MTNDPIVFQMSVVKNKPQSYRKDKNKDICPFFDVENLTDIYAKDGDIIWLHNKFPTLSDTLQTVLIESSDHNGDISTYTKKYNRKLLRFSLQCFERMNRDDKYQSVVWYKNYGPHSGGSLIHPHMQIVGFKNVDGYKYIHPNNFEGETLFDKDGV